jgi:hypothetical protein
MGKRRCILIAASLLAVLAAFVLFGLPQGGPPEPRYQGKRLSVWMKGYGLGEGWEGLNYSGTDDAVRHMGTNAIPYLLWLLHAKDSGSKVFLMRLAGRPPFLDSRAETGYRRACKAFAALGPTGQPAIPELVSIAFGPNAADSIASDLAAQSLASIGADSVPPLIKALADSSPRVRDVAISALGQIGPSAEPAVPALLKALTNSNDNNRVNAASALGLIGKQPTLVVPALAQALRDPYFNVRNYAAISLRKIGKEPGVAVPALIKAVDDANEGVRFLAVAALDDFGADAEAALPKLIFVANDEHDRLHEVASASVDRIKAAIAAKPAPKYLHSQPP